MIDVKDELIQDEVRAFVENLRTSFEWRDTFKPNPNLPFVRSKSGALNFCGYLKPTVIGTDALGNEIKVATRSHVALTAISVQATLEQKAELRVVFERVLAEFKRRGIAPHDASVRAGLRDQMKVLVDPLKEMDKPLLLVAEWPVNDEWKP